MNQSQKSSRPIAPPPPAPEPEIINKPTESTAKPADTTSTPEALSYNGTTIEGGSETLIAKIIERLKTVYDPEIPVNLYDLGLIYLIKFLPQADGKFNLAIDMTLTAPNCPVAGMMPQMVQQSVINLPELNEVDVQLVFTPPWDKSRMSDEAKLMLNMF